MEEHLNKFKSPGKDRIIDYSEKFGEDTMYWDIEITPEDEEEMIRTIAEKIHKYGMEVAAILMLESVKPLSYIGAQMGRLFISPFLPAFGDKIGIGGEKFIQIFEKRENVEKLLEALEELARGETEKPKQESKKPKDEAKPVAELEAAPTKKGWRRFLPF